MKRRQRKKEVIKLVGPWDRGQLKKIMRHIPRRPNYRMIARAMVATGKEVS